MNYWERGSHALGVYPKQYTSRLGTVRVKQLLSLLSLV